MKDSKYEELEKRIAHLEATLDKLFNACYYTSDALHKSGAVWNFFKSRVQ